MTTPSDRALFKIDSVGFGVDNLNGPTGLAQEQSRAGNYKIALREAVNIDIDRKGGIVRREGFSQIDSTRTTSLWFDDRLPFGLCVRNGFLYSLTPPATLVQLSSVTGENVCYEFSNGRVLWSDGVRTGYVASASSWGFWGLPLPPKPVLTSVAGDLTEGRYRAAITCVTASGEESGASSFMEVDISHGQAILVSGVPISGRSDVVGFNAYCSLPHSPQMYLSQRLTLGQATLTINQAQLKTGQELKTLNLQPPQGCRIIRQAFGRVVTAIDNYLTFSEAFSFGLFNPAYNTLPFDSQITALDFTLDGWYVGTNEGLYFLQGTDPGGYRRIRLDSSGVVQGTMIRVGKKYGPDAGSNPLIWLGRNGIFYRGKPGGVVEPVGDGVYKFPRCVSGAVIPRFVSGLRSVVFTAVPDLVNSEMGVNSTIQADAGTFGFANFVLPSVTSI